MVLHRGGTLESCTIITTQTYLIFICHVCISVSQVWDSIGRSVVQQSKVMNYHTVLQRSFAHMAGMGGVGVRNLIIPNAPNGMPLPKVRMRLGDCQVISADQFQLSHGNPYP